MTSQRNLRTSLIAIGVVVLVLIAFGFIEGDLDDSLTHIGSLIAGALDRLGPVASIGLLYIEESGIPLPVPGDVYVAFLGTLYAGSWPGLLGAWLGIITAVVAGATNLYWLSRRWGPSLLRRPFVAALLQVDDRRLARSQQWFDRWGALAIIFGRYLPGLRIPITVVSATLGVPYRIFAPSVAVSSAIWAGVGLWVGATFGHTIQHFLSANPYLYLLVFLLVVLAIAAIVVRAWRSAGERQAASA